MNPPLLIENYSRGPAQGKLIFSIISFPHRSPKRQLILFALKSMGKTPRVGLPRRSRDSRTPELLHTHTSPAPQKLWNPLGWVGIEDPTSGTLCSTLTEQQESCVTPRSPLELCFPGFLREEVFLHQGCRERLSPGRSNIASTRPHFSFLFQMQ